MSRFSFFLFLALGAAPLLSAQTITFAQFTQVNADKSLIFDTTQTGSASFETTDTTNGVGVKFRYNSQLNFTGPLSALMGEQDARFTLQSVASAPASSYYSGGFHIQPVDSGVIEFRRTTPIDGKNLLLRIDFSGVYLVNLGSSGSLLAMENIGSQITYTSDFLTFDSTASNNWALGLSGVSPVTSQCSNQLLSNFTASTAGTFDALATPIPEPATYAVIIGVVALFAAIGKRSYSARHNQA
jgi:hypothetical protein